MIVADHTQGKKHTEIEIQNNSKKKKRERETMRITISLIDQNSIAVLHCFDFHLFHFWLSSFHFSFMFFLFPFTLSFRIIRLHDFLFFCSTFFFTSLLSLFLSLLINILQKLFFNTLSVFYRFGFSFPLKRNETNRHDQLNVILNEGNHRRYFRLSLVRNDHDVGLD